jgi:glycogen(starch) synthase
MPGIYKLADLFVTLSDRTNMANPLNEATLSRLPVIALNAGRTADVVRDDENGVLIETGDLPRLGQIILDLLSDEKRMARLGRAAQRNADERLPTVEERQAMEVEAVARAAREGRERRT